MEGDSGVSVPKVGLVDRTFDFGIRLCLCAAGHELHEPNRYFAILPDADLHRGVDPACDIVRSTITCDIRHEVVAARRRRDVREGLDVLSKEPTARTTHLHRIRVYGDEIGQSIARHVRQDRFSRAGESCGRPLFCRGGEQRHPLPAPDGRLSNWRRPLSRRLSLSPVTSAKNVPTVPANALDDHVSDVLLNLNEVPFGTTGQTLILLAFTAMRSAFPSPVTSAMKNPLAGAPGVEFSQGVACIENELPVDTATLTPAAEMAITSALPSPVTSAKWVARSPFEARQPWPCFSVQRWRAIRRPHANARIAQGDDIGAALPVAVRARDVCEICPDRADERRCGPGRRCRRAGRWGSARHRRRACHRRLRKRIGHLCSPPFGVLRSSQWSWPSPIVRTTPTVVTPSPSQSPTTGTSPVPP